MRAENFVFKIVFFVPSVDLYRVKDVLTDFLQRQGYQYVAPTPPSPYFYMSFRIPIPQSSIPIFLKIKRFLKIIDEEELISKIHFEYLRKLRNDIPFKIDVLIYRGKWKNLNGTIVEVLSIPTIYFKITQLLQSPILVSEEEYSFIATENKIFLEKISKALNGYIIKEPKPLKLYIDSKVIEKLKYFGFEKVAEIMRNGKKKIELGDSSGLDDLRGAIENFLYFLASKLGVNPSPLHKPEDNISFLKTLGYIDEGTERLIKTVLRSGVYSFISNEKTHQRKDVDLFTSRLCFNLVEVVFDYLIERIIRFNMKNVKKDETMQTSKENH